jgi:hypothetical protein
MYKDLEPQTLADFEPGTFCSWGVRDDQYVTLPGQAMPIYIFHIKTQSIPTIQYH